MVIAQLQHDNRELKNTALERTPKIGETEPMTKATPFVTKSKHKEKIVTEDIQGLEAP